MSYDKNQDRLDAERYAAQRENARKEDTAALSGMTLGILLALAIAAAIGAYFVLSRRDEPVPATNPIVIPSASPATPEKETIIREEKTRELVPVPQATTQPNINITVPSAPSAPSPAAAPPAATSSPPAAAPSAPDNESSSSTQDSEQTESPSPSSAN
ncbi:hypothetical protein [Altericista sp. CCNU0014]|uniref:hypothetical protein n=1 Tax=Altericista sp. CCNU0014 TaxID=3082949 RepID=UPI00384B98F3